MYQFNIMIYFIILGITFYIQNPILTGLWVFTGILILAFYPLYRKIRKKAIKAKSVILNVNRANWWEIEELPGFEKVSAKKVVWLRNKNGRYASKEDFYKLNKITNTSELENLIKI